MNRLPRLEHTSNETGRLLVYSIHRFDQVYHLVKDVIFKNEVFRDRHFLYSTLDYERLHREMLLQGFAPLCPMPEDDPAIIMTYV